MAARVVDPGRTFPRHAAMLVLIDLPADARCGAGSTSGRPGSAGVKRRNQLCWNCPRPQCIRNTPCAR